MKGQDVIPGKRIVKLNNVPEAAGHSLPNYWFLSGCLLQVSFPVNPKACHPDNGCEQDRHKYMLRNGFN